MCDDTLNRTGGNQPASPGLRRMARWAHRCGPHLRMPLLIVWVPLLISATASTLSNSSQFNASDYGISDTKVVTVASKQYVSCESFADCVNILGISRFDCISGLHVLNEETQVLVTLPDVCTCGKDFFFSQATDDGRNCEAGSFEARCMVSEKSGTTSACKVHAPGAVMIIIFFTINMSMQAALLLLGFKILVGLVRGGQTLQNATGSTLVFTILGTVGMILWTLYYAAAYAALATHTMRSINTVSFDVGIPAASVLVATACMNLALMWIQVAQSAKSLQRSGSNLGRKPQILVAVFAIAFGLVEIVCFAIISQNAIGSAISLLFFFGIGGSFLVGSRRLAFAMRGTAADNSVPSIPGSARSLRPKKSTSQSSPRLRGIIKLGRRIGIIVFIYCLFALIYTAVRTTRSWGYGTNEKPALLPAWPAVEQICVFGVIFSVNVLLMHLMDYVKDVTAVKRGVTTTMPTVGETKSETCSAYRSESQRCCGKGERPFV